MEEIMTLEGKRVLILVEEMFNVFEFWYPYYRLQEEGVEVVVVGSGSAEVYNGKPGTQIKADIAADKVSLEGVDGVVIPGGYAPDMMRRYPAMVNIVKELYRNDKLVASICHAGWMLASADILRGKNATSFFAIKDDMINAGAKWVDQQVVVDGKLVTSRKPDDLPAFMKAVIGVLRQ
jgi:protease I